MNKFQPNRGQIQITLITQILGFIAAIIAPVLYVGNVKENVAIQNVKITALEKNIDEIKGNTEYIRRTLEDMSKTRAESKTLFATSTRQ